jgi:hypothetical protein
MSPWKTVRTSLVLLALLSLAAAAYALGADDAKKSQPALTPEQQKEMEAWMAVARPGKEHEAMKRMEGTFDVTVEMVMQPGTPAEKSAGKQTAKMIFGGRYLHADFTGESMGQAFHGASLTGYDNVKKKHFSAWIDDMGTGLLTAEGTASADGKVITLHGEYTDPMQKKHTFRWVTTIESDDQYTFDWFDTAAGGKEFRMMRATYTRTK